MNFNKTFKINFKVLDRCIIVAFSFIAEPVVSNDLPARGFLHFLIARPVITSDLRNITNSLNQPVTLDCQAKGFPKVETKWSRVIENGRNFSEEGYLLEQEIANFDCLLPKQRK